MRGTAKPVMPHFSLSPIKLPVGDDESGALVLVDGRLVAVVSKLDADYHGVDSGRWYLEAGFGRCSGITPRPFASLSDVLRWVADRLGVELPGDLPVSIAPGLNDPHPGGVARAP